MPKLLIINIASNWGSHGRIIENVGLYCVSKGWDVKVAHGQFSTPSQLDTIPVGDKKTLWCHYLMSAFDSHGLGSRKATEKLVETIKEYDPDVIHLHIIHDYYLNYKVLFSYLRSCGKPIVWTFHDCWAFTGHCAHFEYENCYKWKTGCHHCMNTHKYPMAFVDRSKRNYRLKQKVFTSVRNMTIVACSQWLEKFVAESFLRDYPLMTIYNGIDQQDFHHTTDKELIKRCNIPRDKFIILGLASRWDEKKGLLDFYELDKLLEHRTYQIVLVGLKHTQIASLPSSIIGIERTNNKTELAALYSHASVFVNPTYEDTLPTTNIEAMACGTPVVTYYTGGCPETIDEKTGFVVARGDVKGIYKSIEKIRANGRVAYKEVCSVRARELFSSEKCSETYEALYTRLIEGAPSLEDGGF